MIFTGLKLKLILKRIFWGVLIIPCLLGYAICFAQDFSVTYQNGLLSVRADNTLIESLFDSIAGQCGISVKIYPEMKSVKVSRTFENKPLIPVDRCLWCGFELRKTGFRLQTFRNLEKNAIRAGRMCLKSK